MPETIMMIHGISGGKWCWKNYQRFFEEKGYYCLVPVLRFHDQGPKAPPPASLGNVSLLDYVADLEKQIKQLSSLPIIIGHSMGGLLAQMLASKNLAKAIVLLAPVAPWGIIVWQPMSARGVWNILTTWQFWKKPVRQTFEEAVFSMFNLLPPEKQKRAFEQLVFESGRVIFEMGFWFLDRHRASRVLKEKVRCPVLVIAGAKDKTISPAIGRQISHRYSPFSSYKEFPNNGHWLIQEPGWQKIASYIHQWLLKHSRPSKTTR